MTTDEPFPHLTPENHRVTSPPDARYNCIAWVAGDTDRWWQPGVCWPTPAEAGDWGLGALEAAFRALGYATCADGSLEPGFEKVVLFGDGVFYTHAARQLPNGKWTSKLGGAEDIEHDTPDDVAGGIYGAVARFMKRPVPA
jgi:hypothetical protein